MWLGWLVRLGLVLCVSGAVAVSRSQASSWAVVDLRTGALLLGERAEELQPAGAAYQLLVLLSALEQAQLGMLPLDVPVSVDAHTLNELGSRPGEPLRLAANKTYLFSDLLKAVLLSRSDLAAAVAAEAMWGSRDNAVEALNERAQRLGLTSTRVTGLTCEASGNVTTAYEFARLVAVLWREHEELRQWGTLRGFPFDEGRIVVANSHMPPSDVGVWAFYDRFRDSRRRARLYQRLGALVSEQDGMALVAVRLGVEDVALAMENLIGNLQQVRAEYEPVTVVRAGELLGVRVFVEGGVEPFVVPSAAEEVRIPRRKGTDGRVEVLFQLPSVVTAPVAKGERLGELVVRFDDRAWVVVPAVSPKAIGSRGVRAADVQKTR